MQPQAYGIYRHLFELVIKIACIFATSSLIFQAFSAYLDHLNILWQFHVSYSAFILLEASLIVTWFALETQVEVPKTIKLVASILLLAILGVIFFVSEMYISGVNLHLKTLLFSFIFLRCIIASSFPVYVFARVKEHRRTRKLTLIAMRKQSEQTQRLIAMNDMIDRALLLEKQKEALREVKQLKHQLITRAYTKHNLALAQLNAKAEQINNRYEAMAAQHN